MARWLNRRLFVPTCGWKGEFSPKVTVRSPSGAVLVDAARVVDHVLKEKLRDGRGQEALFDRNADLARLLDIERQHGDMIALGLEHQAVDDAHTELVCQRLLCQSFFFTATQNARPLSILPSCLSSCTAL